MTSRLKEGGEEDPARPGPRGRSPEALETNSMSSEPLAPNPGRSLRESSSQELRPPKNSLHGSGSTGLDDSSGISLAGEGEPQEKYFAPYAFSCSHAHAPMRVGVPTLSLEIE